MSAQPDTPGDSSTTEHAGGVNLRHQVLSGLRWATASRVIAQLLSWVSIFVVIRLISPADFGLVALAVVLPNFLSMMNEMGLNAALVQRQTRDRETLQAVFGFSILLALGLCVALVLVAPIAGMVTEDARVVPLFRLVSLQFITMSLAVIPSARLSMDMRFRELGMAGAGAAVLSAIVTLVLAWRGFGAYSLIVGIVVLSASRAAMLNVYCPSIYWPSFRFTRLGGIGRFSGQSFVRITLWYWYIQADVFIVGRALGASLLGIYAVGRQLTTIPLERVMPILNAVALPAYSKINSEADQVRANYLKALRLGAVYAFPTFWGLALVAGPAVRLLLGSKWLAAVPVIQILCLVMPLRMLNAFTASLTTALDRQDVPIRSALLALILVPTAIVAGLRWGVTGVAVGWVVAFPFVYAYDVWLVKRTIRLRLREIFAAILPPSAAASVMVAVVLVVNHFLSYRRVPPIAELCADITAGGLMFVAALCLFGRRNIAEVFMLLRGFLGAGSDD